MAQLPPKMPLNNPPHHSQSQDQHHQTHWHDILSNPMSTMSPKDLNFPQSSSWMDEFIEFSGAKRSAHRRSMSDSITFVLDDIRGPEEEGGGNDGVVVVSNGGKSHHHEFERFDDEQFMSMFNNDVANAKVPGPANSSSNPTSDSDRNSINEDKREQQEEEKVTKNEHEEVESSCKTAGKDSGQTKAGVAKTTDANAAAATNAAGAAALPANNEAITDPKRVKRILANRQSAQRSRVRKLQYISELERSVASLQTEVSMLSPRVAFLDHHRMLLNVDNSALKAKIAALAQDKIFKDAHQEALRREIERLRQVYYQQTLKRAEYSVTPTSPSPPESAAAQPPTCDIQVNEKEQLIS
ncbi:hypothetical protein Ancab_011091 [Ancistrocladus abbreviatus]